MTQTHETRLAEGTAESKLIELTDDEAGDVSGGKWVYWDCTYYDIPAKCWTWID
jgi:hypothetical protein